MPPDTTHNKNTYLFQVFSVCFHTPNRPAGRLIFPTQAPQLRNVTNPHARRYRTCDKPWNIPRFNSSPVPLYWQVCHITYLRKTKPRAPGRFLDTSWTSGMPYFNLKCPPIQHITKTHICSKYFPYVFILPIDRLGG